MFNLFYLYYPGLKHYLSFIPSSNSRGKGHNKKAHVNNYKKKILLRRLKG